MLLILAGVSIQMLTGQNGILTRAGEAKEKDDEAQISEKIKLAEFAAMVNKNATVDYGELKKALTTELGTEGTDWTISEEMDTPWKVTVKGKEYEINSSTSTKGTTPYYPSTAFHQLPGTSLKNGLVITDATDPSDTENPGNEYVWIEVPRTASTYGSSFNLNYDFETMSNEEKEAAYTAIAGALRTYCTKNASGGSLIKDGTSSEGTYGNTSTYGYKDVWYDSTGKDASTSTNLNDTGGCGLTNEKYIELYNKMLQSVYEHGGFWIGRYEAGTNTPRGAETDSIDGLMPLSKVNSYPINYVKCSEAQTIASRVNNIDTTKYTSSLMFGIQWDLVVRHLSNKGIATDKLTGDSSTWGNYYNQQFEINRGEYSVASPWNVYKAYTEATADKVSIEDGKSKKIGTTSANKILLTTGAADVNSKINIYDLAGNVFEWTLEKTSYSGYPCAYRGGLIRYTGYHYPASNRRYYNTSDSFSVSRSSCHTLLI